MDNKKVPDAYEKAWQEAILRARKTGHEYGLRKDFFGNWQIRMLPKPENRYGDDLRCQVVRANEPLLY